MNTLRSDDNLEHSQSKHSRTRIRNLWVVIFKDQRSSQGLQSVFCESRPAAIFRKFHHGTFPAFIRFDIITLQYSAGGRNAIIVNKRRKLTRRVLKTVTLNCSYCCFILFAKLKVRISNDQREGLKCFSNSFTR